MHAINEILTPARTICGAPGVSKKRLFETIAKIVSDDQPSLPYDDVLSKLIAREKLGSTGLGQGIAIPHCRVGKCAQPLGSLLTLKDPISFDAPDDKPVDLMFVLLVPEEAHQQHLDILSTIAQLFSESVFCQKLRDARDDRALYDLACGAAG